MIDSPLFPVILAVPGRERRLRGRDQVVFLSRFARYALALSAERSQGTLGPLAKNADGVPQPVNGWHWSLTHKTDYVGAVVAREPIGIDLEMIRPCSDKLFKRVANTREWQLGDTDRTTLFFRYWTSKETVLKATGVGFKGLYKCRVESISDDHHLMIEFQQNHWPIEHCYFDGHIASVLKIADGITWTVLDETLRPLGAERVRGPD